MALLLKSSGSGRIIVYSKGIPTLISSYQQSGGQAFLKLRNSNKNFIHCALLRTSGLGTPGPYESPPLRQSSSATTSINVGPGGQVISNQDDERITQSEANQLEEHKELQAKKHLLEKKILPVLKAVTKVYDYSTLPIYAAFQQPWKKVALHNAIKAIPIDKDATTYTSAIPKGELHQELNDYGVTTMLQLFNRAIEKHGPKLSLGTRQILSEEEVLDPSTNKMIKKYELGDYEWKTYSQVYEIVDKLSRGFEVLELKPKEKFAIFAETREEWLLTALAAFKKNLPIVTVFTTLADEGVIHALTQTEVTTLVTSEELMPRCKEILKSIPNIKKVVYMNKKSGNSIWNHDEELPNNVEVHTYNELIERGSKLPKLASDPNSEPVPDDVAIIMYTSGSTGVPKGVMLSHKNMLSGLKCSMDITCLVGAARPDDAYLAYLPLAHVMEIMCECMTFIQGIPIGYSSPLTLTDKSLGVKEGSKGDASIIRPTVLPAVPLVVERIVKGIKEKVAESGPVKELLFNYFVNYKIAWKKLGYETPLLNKVFFSKITSLVGGRMRYLVVGGAPLAPATQEFISAALCCPVAIGYGMTETSSTGAMTICHDLTPGRAGGPISCSYFRLVNWEEGGYRVTDQPHPRGELYIGGDNVALGYFKRENSTDFFEENGIRWIKTGDIAQVDPDGVFTIIDRKKDLVKISTGKFVSFGKIEAVLKVSPFVENICVYADSKRDYTIAMIVPARAHVEKLAREFGLSLDNYDSLCQNHLIHQAILEDIQEQGKLLNLSKYEIPRKILLCSEPWMPASGLVTAAFKIKRSNVYKEYKEDISRMYS